MLIAKITFLIWIGPDPPGVPRLCARCTSRILTTNRTERDGSPPTSSRRNIGERFRRPRLCSTRFFSGELTIAL